MAFYITLASKVERAVRAFIILQNPQFIIGNFLNNDCFTSNSSQQRTLPNRTIVATSIDPQRKQRPEAIVHLEIQHNFSGTIQPGTTDQDTARVNLDQYVGETGDTMNISQLDNDDAMDLLSAGITNAGRWLAIPPPNPATDPLGVQIATDNADMVNFRVDWVRLAHPLHTRGKDQATTNWLEILHFELGCSYASN